MKLQLIFPQHSLGKIAGNQNLPPPLGVLTLAAYLQQERPDVEVEVYDGNRISEDDLIDKINVPLVGISTWFSNYESGVDLARKIKDRKPQTKIVFGGPHMSSMARRVLSNNDTIDFVVAGDAEQSLVELVSGRDLGLIPGLTFRNGERIQSNAPDFTLSLDRIPPVSLTPLATPYEWNPDPDQSGHSYFPISMFRGCFRDPRCMYCSIPVEKLRGSSPDAFWNQVGTLYDEAGITGFFETADIFPIKVVPGLIANRPRELGHTTFRMYLFPGMVNERKAEQLAQLGVHSVFYGVESVQFFADFAHHRDAAHPVHRSYGKRYTTDSFLQEVQTLKKHGICVTPGFVLGLPGETQQSLADNTTFIREVAAQPFVHEVLVNEPLPLPNSEYFDWTMGSESIVGKYYDRTGENLRMIDRIDYQVLSKLFVDEFTRAGYERVSGVMDELTRQLDGKTNHFLGS